MSRARLVELTNLCVICDGSRVLVQDKVGCGVVFPGGHVEPGESMLSSVIREMREETGLVIEHPTLCGIKDWMREDGTRFIVALYRADRFSGSLKSSEEGRVFWMEREDFARLDTIWGDARGTARMRQRGLQRNVLFRREGWLGAARLRGTHEKRAEK